LCSRYPFCAGNQKLAIRTARRAPFVGRDREVAARRRIKAMTTPPRLPPLFETLLGRNTHYLSGFVIFWCNAFLSNASASVPSFARFLIGNAVCVLLSVYWPATNHVLAH
jgi:hypothetical protein